MNPFNRLAEALLGQLIGLLSPVRREWAEAIRAELDVLPPGRERLRWLAGGLRAILPGPAAACQVIAMAAVLALNCVISTGYRGALTIQLSTALTVLVLAGLPLLGRQRFGARPGSPIARAVRLGGYLGIGALLVVLGQIRSFASSSDNNPAFGDRASQVVVALLLSGLLVGHGATLLVLTGRRAAIRPASLALGATAGLIGGLTIWAMLPTGAPWHPHGGLVRAGYPAFWAMTVLLAIGLPLLAGWFSARQGPHQGYAAGVCAGVVGTLVLLVCTLASMRIFPHSVPLEWANPDPSVPHGTPFEWRMSLQDHAASYLWLLLFGPLVGIGFGAAGTALADERSIVGEPGLPR